MTNAQHATENLTIHIKVKDYATWRTGYDGREKGRLSAGITDGRVFRRAEDPNCRIRNCGRHPGSGFGDPADCLDFSSRWSGDRRNGYRVTVGVWNNRLRIDRARRDIGYSR